MMRGVRNKWSLEGKSIKVYQRALLLIFVTMVMFNGTVGIMTIWTVSENYKNVLDETILQSGLMNEIDSGYTRMILELQGYLYQGSSVENLERLYLELANLKSKNFLVIKGSKKLEASNVNEKQRMENIQLVLNELDHVLDGMVVVARSGDIEEAKRLLTDIQNNKLSYLSYNIKLYVKEQRIAINTLYKRVQEYRNLMLFTMLVANVFVIIVFYLMERIYERAIYKPITRLSAQMADIDSSRLDNTFKSEDKYKVKEIVTLGNTANDMRHRLSIAFEQISSQNEELEEKVNLRTVEIRVANEKLQETLDDLTETQIKLIGVKKQEVANHLVRNLLHRVNSPLGTAIVSLDYAVSLTGDAHNQGMQESLGIVSTSLERIHVIMKSLKRMLEYDENEEAAVVNPVEIVEGAFRESFVWVKNANRILNIEELSSERVEIKGNSFKNALTSLFNYAIQQRLLNPEKYAPARIRMVLQGQYLMIDYSDETLIEVEDETGYFDPYGYANFQTNDTGLEMVILHNIVTIALMGELMIKQIGQNNETVLSITIPVRVERGVNP